MALITDIRVALAASLSTITDTQVSAYMLSNPTPPTAHIIPGSVEYDQAMGRGIDLLMLTAQVFIGLVSDIQAQKKLDEYLAGSGARSVKQALEADRTLGGACQTLRVTRSSGYRVASNAGGGQVLLAEWEIEVFATGG